MWCGLRLRPNFGEGPAIQKVWPRKMDTFRTRWSWTASRWNAAGHSTLGVDGRRHKQPKRRLCLKKEKEKKEEILEDTERMTSWFVGGSDGRRWQFTEFYRVSSGCVCVCVWKAERPKSFDDWWPLDTPGNRRLNYGPINCRPHLFFFLLFWVFFSFIGRPLLNEVVPARRHRQAGVSPLIDGRFNGHRQRRADERPNTPIMRRSAGPFGGHWREVKKKRAAIKKNFKKNFNKNLQPSGTHTSA